MKRLDKIHLPQLKGTVSSWPYMWHFFDCLWVASFKC